MMHGALRSVLNGGVNALWFEVRQPDVFFIPRKTSKLTEQGTPRPVVGVTLVLPWPAGTLRLRSRDSGLLKNPSRLADIRDAKENQRRVRLRFQPAISVVDVDVGFPKAGC